MLSGYVVALELLIYGSIQKRLSSCNPKDVGWFSHENPFEFDIHNFRYHDSALKFWGGTPVVAPFAIATNSINYFTNIGIKKYKKT